MIQNYLEDSNTRASMQLSTCLAFLLTLALAATVKADHCDDAKAACLSKSNNGFYCMSQYNWCKYAEPH